VVKRKVFNATLKQLTDCLERMCSGNRLPYVFFWQIIVTLYNDDDINNSPS